jgi:hypothetical protein
MNDTLIIAMPTWFYWFLVAWLALDATRTILNIFNQYLQYRINKQS